MLVQGQLEKLDDYFIKLNSRKCKGVFFYRINGYNLQIRDFIKKYYEQARLRGVIIEGRLKNPDSKNLSYYFEIMGPSFQMNVDFINKSLGKWLPRMNLSQRNAVALSIYEVLCSLKKAGKNDNVLKNTYIKFMCWLYYRFEGIINHLGEEQLPKVLCEGSVSSYELMLLSVLSISGCDIVLLQYQGDSNYLKIDPKSEKSIAYTEDNMQAFPAGFSIKQIRRDIEDQINSERLYGTQPKYIPCTNKWISGRIIDNVKKDVQSRGSNTTVFYNCFCRINGVEDRLTYANDLYQLQLGIKNDNRDILILNTIDVPTVEEISSIKRGSYKNLQQLILKLRENISYAASIDLQVLMGKAFVDCILEESRIPEMNLNKLTNKAVYLLCWLSRYQSQLFSRWSFPKISCFFYMGGCRNEGEALFIKFLSKLPVDVVIFNPDLNRKCCLIDSGLYEENYQESLSLDEYPEDSAGLRVGTVAYHAERDLDTLMYQDTGMYRNQQYSKANVLSLQTMYEEIQILWDQEIKYRPNFSIVDNVVNIPVIFSKICGVKNKDLQAYWREIKNLITEDTILIDQIPYITATTSNPIKPYVTEFYKNGRLQKEKLKAHKAYQYGFLRDSVQDFLIEKIKELIDQKIIKGTFENGTEYTILSTALNLEKRIVREIQKFDFTKKNPKIIYVITSEEMFSLEDTIMMVFLNQIGFDTVVYVPTGYQCIEKFLNKDIIEEHQIGDYMYDLQIPNFDTLSNNSHQSWRERIFGKGK